MDGFGEFLIKVISSVLALLFLMGVTICVWIFGIITYNMSIKIIEFFSNVFSNLWYNYIK